MRNNSDDVATVAATPRRTSRATKLIQAAALAAMLVPLGAVAAEAGNINCVSSTAGGSGCVLTFSGAGVQSNTWTFFSDPSFSGSPIYSFTVAGSLLNSFDLYVKDVVRSSSLYGPLVGVGLSCVPTFNNDNLCGFFQATQVGEGGFDPDGYRATILWNGVEPPPVDPQITILKTDVYTSPPPGAEFFIPDPDFRGATMLTEIRYAPTLPSPDPGIGGKGNGFSTFGVFRGPDLPSATVVDTKAQLFAVPDPASSMMLFGTALAGLAALRRRWQK